MNSIKYRCPECESDQVTCCDVQSYMSNTGDFFCHSHKTHDSGSPSTCLECWWEGSKQDTEVKIDD